MREAAAVVVVADRDEDFAAYAEVLSALGCKVRRAYRDGDEAKRIVEHGDHDVALVVIDIDDDGALAVATRIGACEFPMVLVTADATTERTIAAYAAGAHDVLAKPVHPEVLRAKTRAYLQRHPSRELLAMLGHELRNPLATMTMALELLKIKDPEPAREIAILDRQVAHLTHIVGDLVDVARITQGKIALRREAVSVAQAVTEAIDSLRPLIDQHDVEIKVPRALMVDADRLRLAQVLTNLLSNAAKYTPAPGRIDIAASDDGEEAMIVVRDNGRGISRSLLPKVFDLFVQGERGPDRRDGGLGIGLTLVRTLVELHGGDVEAYSSGPGEGAMFTVRWPLASRATATGRIQAVERPIAAGPLRVLIVDDNMDAAEMLAAVVSALGHEIMLAHDGLDGLKVAREFAPHVALLDIGLPTLDGYELAMRMHAVAECADTRLIAVTGYGRPEDRERSRRAGFMHHLVKPVDFAMLRALLATHDDTA
jgi:signal transduction histidine kinase/ActR/RegA family two-component response regulator